LANPNADRLILVTGATGKQGGTVLRHLRAKGFPVRALTRDPSQPSARALLDEGAEVTGGNMDDIDSLRRAMEGVWGVFSVQPYQAGPEAETREGIALADAAQRSRVNYFVYSSVGGADRNTGIPHFDSKYKIEEHVRTTGIPYTIFRPVFFMENWLAMKDSLRQGVISLPLRPERKLSMIAVDDIGAFVALAFERTGHWRERAFELAGDDLTMNEVARRFGQKLGREVKYQQMPWDDCERRFGHNLTVMYRWLDEYGYNTDVAAVRAEYGGLTSFSKWLNGISL
jgi:uncharacterized protein YbjT (DUF2867 family)